jgi:hypothetical protein
MLTKLQKIFLLRLRLIPKKQRIDFIGILTMTVTLVSFLIAITFSGSIATNLIAFVVPLAIGIIFLVLFIIVER